MLLNTHDPISLGLPHRAVEITKRLFNDKRPFIILVAGSRRSGRSTTLSALARLHAVNQVQAGEIGTRATSCLNWLPLVRMDDLRDARSARCAVEVVRTGYGLIATMVSGCAWSTLRRFHDLGDQALPRIGDIEGFAGVFVIYQALMPKLCPKCSVRSHHDAGLSMPGPGCDLCQGSSYYGSTLVSEFMHVTSGHALFTTTDEDDRQRLLTAQEDDWLREFSKRCVEALLDDTAIRAGLLLNGTQGL